MKKARFWPNAIRCLLAKLLDHSREAIISSDLLQDSLGSMALMADCIRHR